MAIWPRGTIVPTATGFTVCSRHTPAFAYRLSWGAAARINRSACRNHTPTYARIGHPSKKDSSFCAA